MKKSIKSLFYIQIVVMVFCILTSAHSGTPVDFTEPIIDVIVLKSSDVDYPDEEKLDSIRTAVSKVQSYYQNQMVKHGFEPKTFETNDIVVSERKHPLSYYTDSQRVSDEMWADHFNYISLDNNIIYLIYVLGSDNFEGGAARFGVNWSNRSGTIIGKSSLCIIPTEIEDVIEAITGHELGHAFLDSGVHHEDEHNLMYHTKCSTCGRIDIEKQTLDYDQVAQIAENPYFHHTIEDQDKKYIPKTSLNADVNGDGYTDLYDVMIVRSGMTGETSYDTDINNDGITDEVDLLIVKAKAFEAIAAAAPRKRKINITSWGAMKR